MSRSGRLFLQDIDEAAAKIERHTKDLSLEQFLANDLVYDAVLRNLEIIGEATKGLPESVRERASAIDWRRVAGLRDVLAHAYFALDDQTLWDIIQNKIPQLLAEVRRLLSDAEA